MKNQTFNGSFGNPFTNQTLYNSHQEPPRNDPGRKMRRELSRDGSRKGMRSQQSAEQRYGEKLSSSDFERMSLSSKDKDRGVENAEDQQQI
jgi:hypothetical protein